VAEPPPHEQRKESEQFPTEAGSPPHRQPEASEYFPPAADVPMQTAPEPPPVDDLSVSMKRLRSEHSGLRSAEELAEAVLTDQAHGSYGGGIGASLGRSGLTRGSPPLPVTSTPRPVDDWIGEVRTLFVRQATGQLDGRKFLLGLALLVPELRRRFADAEFLEPLEAEIPNLARSLSGRGSALRRPDAVPTLSDQPSQVDQLGRKAFAEALAARIRDEYERSRLTPEHEPDSFMLHLEGPWGSGKTSLLGFLRTELESQPDQWVVVWFNAWQHQRVGEPLWFLIREVYRSAAREANAARKARLWLDALLWGLWLSRWRVVGLLVSLALLSTVIALAVWKGTDTSTLGVIGVVAGLLTSVLGATGALRSLAGSVGTAASAAEFRERITDPTDVLKRRFRKLIDAIGAPVAIFVDDLDRCRAQYVVDLLEGIQTVLRDPPVTFVVASDRRWLYDSYAQVYADYGRGGVDPGRPLGHLFLEKTFQLSTSVPRLSRDAQQSYWESLIFPPATAEDLAGLQASVEHEFAKLRTEESIFSHLDNHAASSPEVQRMARAAAVRQLGTPALQRHTEHTLIRFAPLLESNPRAMKRLVNAYGVERALQIIGGHSTALEYARERLALWTILKSRWPLLADYLVDRPEAVEPLRTGVLPPDVSLDTDRPYLVKLFASDEVKRVVNGTVVGVALDGASLRLLLDGPAAEEVLHS
jgi:hypothetical protein